MDNSRPPKGFDGELSQTALTVEVSAERDGHGRSRLNSVTLANCQTWGKIKKSLMRLKKYHLNMRL
ncbi:hypothetical protein [Phormidium nigroviride]